MSQLYWIDYAFLAILSIIIGGLLGSFTTAIIYRIPRNIPIAFGKSSAQGGAVDGAARSYCTECGHALGFWDLIPVLSYLFLKGRCRHCQASISSKYLLVEIGTIILAALVLFLAPSLITQLLFLAALPVLISLLVIDLEHFILPNKLVLALLLLGIAMRIYTDVVMVEGDLVKALSSAALDMCLFAAIAYLIGFVFEKILKKEALGLGDVKFYAAAGVWIGLGLLPVFMIISGALGLLHGGYRRLVMDDMIFPFGPSLIIAAVICYLYSGFLTSLLYGA